MQSRRIKYLLLYLALAIAIVLFIGSINWMTYYRLSKQGIGTKAVVTKTNCSNHMTFSYRFDFNGQSIDGSGGDGYGNPSCDTLKQGDPVLIYYLSSQPEINVPGDPKERLNNETISIAMAALIFPALLVFAINRWAKKQKQV
jgi:hypothetical protein